MIARVLTYWQRISLIHLFVLAALLAMAMHYLALPKITAKTIQHLPKERSIPILLPQMAPDYYPAENSSNYHGVYLYNFTLEYRHGQQTRFAFYPVGCVEQIILNDINIPLGNISNCNLQPGFMVELEPFLHPGANLMQVKLSNVRNFRGARSYDTSTLGLQMGPKLISLNKPGFSEMFAIALLVISCLIIIRIIQHFTTEIISGLIISGGLLVYLRHFCITNFMQYTIDMPSHLQYIVFIANRGFWPKPYFGWEYYHPPFYYHLEAIVMWLANWLGSFDSISLMRLFSLLCFMAFLCFSALTLHRLIANKAAYYLALVLLALYPTGIIFATRLDSHLLYYAFAAACTYFLLCWIQDTKDKYLWFSLIAFGFAIGTRSNALVLIPVIGTAVLYQWCRHIFRFSKVFSVGMVFSLLCIALGIAGNFGRTAYYHITERNTMPYIVGNIASIQQTQAVKTTLEHMLLIDMQQLFNPPFLTWWHDYTGRQYFWNAMLKTSLFEHFSWRDVQRAKMLLFLLLALIAYTIISTCTQTIQKRLEWRICVITLFIPIVMLMINRIMHPYAPSQDFRYIYPSLVSFCAMIGLIVEHHITNRKYTGAAAGIVIILAFSACSHMVIAAG